MIHSSLLLLCLGQVGLARGVRKNPTPVPAAGHPVPIPATSHPGPIPATSQAGHLTQAPAAHSAHPHDVDLTDVITKAVDLMNSGILQFLKEEGSMKVPHEDGHAPASDDFWKVAKSQRKAMAVIRQISTDFDGLRSVAQKLKLHGYHSLGKGASHEMAVLKEERARLQDAVGQLQQKALVCEDNLQNAQKVVYTCDEEVAKQVNKKADEDTTTLKIAEQKVNEMASNMDMLRRENQELKERLQNKERSLSAYEGDGTNKAGAVFKEVEELRQEKQNLQADKDGLVHTIQNLLKANHSQNLTASMQKEISALKKEKAQMDIANRKKVAALENQLKDLKDKQDDVKEVAQTLQGQNAGLVEAQDKVHAELMKCKADMKNLGDDKNQLLQSLQGVLRQNTKFQEQLTQEEARRADAPPLRNASSEPKVAPAAHKAAKTAVASGADDIAAVMGETRAIDHYIASAVDESNFSPPPPPPVEPPRPVRALRASRNSNAAKAPLSKSKLSQWLDTPGGNSAGAVKAAAAVAEHDEDAKIGGSVDSLLRQAEQAVDEVGASDAGSSVGEQLGSSADDGSDDEA